MTLYKMSSRGQIVIPLKMRSDFEEGEHFVIMKNDSQIILKRASDFSKNIKEDLEFAKRTEDAWKAYDRGEFKTYSEKEFLKKLEEW